MPARGRSLEVPPTRATRPACGGERAATGCSCRQRGGEPAARGPRRRGRGRLARGGGQPAAGDVGTYRRRGDRWRSLWRGEGRPARGGERAAAGCSCRQRGGGPAAGGPRRRGRGRLARGGGQPAAGGVHRRDVSPSPEGQSALLYPSPHLLPTLPLQVVQQGLTPEMALRACNNPRIRGDAPSPAVAKLVAGGRRGPPGRLL